MAEVRYTVRCFFIPTVQISNTKWEKGKPQVRDILMTAIHSPELWTPRRIAVIEKHILNTANYFLEQTGKHVC